MKTDPTYGEVRNRSKFLLLPKKIGNRWYWLRYCTVTEVYTKDYYLDVSNYTDEILGYIDGWMPVKYEV